MDILSRKRVRGWIVQGCLGSVLLTGCHPVDRFHAWRDSKNVSYYQDFITRIEEPCPTRCMETEIPETLNPFAIENPADLPVMELSLQDAIQMALQNSEVLRNIGGTVVTAPQGTATQIDPALTDLNPLAGTQAALAAFDATVSSQLFWQKNDLPQNFSPSGLPPEIANLLGVFAFNQTLGTNINQIQKRTATGATFALRSNVIYDRNNRPNRKYESDFSGFMEAEYRQPLMQGAGTTFNRIAGPNGVVGQYNGVLIARINTDISLADFENGVIRLINDVETAYWELYFAYRSLEAQISGRENALRTWQRIRELQKVGYRGGEADAEAQARSNYYLFASQLNDALSGPNGLYAAEQRLRYMIGIQATDGRLLKPIDDPIQAEVMFDWQASLSDATNRRVEVRRQEWSIKRRELELIAARLNKRPRFDALTRYRYRALGDHLFGARNPSEPTDSFFANLGTGDYQEWQGGFEWNYNVGLRQASAAVRHAQLNLAREVAVLKEQQLRISHDLSNAARQISRSYEQMQINYNRIEADKLQVEVLRNRYEKGLININFLLQAQQQLANSTSAFFRSLVDYNLAIRDFHREKGSLLNYNQVSLSEEPLNGSMLSGAYDRGRYFTPRDNPEEVVVRDRISAGAFDPTSVGTPSMGAAANDIGAPETLPPVQTVEPSALAPQIPTLESLPK
ncbi:MAG: TolC family protein [Pirellula sp.]